MKPQNKLFTKLILTGFILLLFFAGNMSAQTLDFKVKRLAPYPTSRDILYVTKLVDGRLVGVLKSNGLLYSNDDGLTWDEDFTLKTESVPVQIVSHSQQTFCGITERGEYFETRDGGKTFSVKWLLSGYTPEFTFSRLRFINSRVAIISMFDQLRPFLFLTLDGWLTKITLTPPVEYSDGDATICADSTIILSGNNCLYRSTDLGLSWVPVLYSNKGTFFDHGDGKTSFFSKKDSVFTSSDYGATWSYRSKAPMTTSRDQAGILNDGSIYLPSDDFVFNTLYISRDSMLTWGDTIDLGRSYRGRMNWFVMANDSTGIFVGSNGCIYRYASGFIRTEITKPYVSSNRASFSDTLRGIHSRGAYTTDGGFTWSPNTPLIGNSQADIGSKLKLTPANFGVLGFNSEYRLYPFPDPFATSQIFATSNSGQTWNQMEYLEPYSTRNITTFGDSIAILFLKNYQTGLSNEVRVVSLTNGGFNYQSISTSVNFRHLAAIHAKKMLLATTLDSIIVSYDTAKTWTGLLKPGTPPNFSNIMANESGTILAISSTKIYSSTDFGVTWHTDLYPNSYFGTNIYSLSDDGLLTTASTTRLLVTHQNWGQWQTLEHDFGEFIKNLEFTGKRTLMMQAGTYGFYRIDFADSVTTPVKGDDLPQSPVGFSLSQNYPNPFNPETVIRYALPVAGWVKGTVYDILGRKVATPLEGEMSAGNHQVKFDATGVASGVYIFRLEAGKYSSAIKMIVNK